MLDRKISKQIENYLKSGGDKMLVVDGARQIGKSFIIREIGSRLFPNFIEINMEKDKQGDRLFAEAKTTENFYLALSAVAGDRMSDKKSTLVFIDEIQAYDHLLTLVKFLMEDGRFTYIASGSLLGVTLKKTQSIPIGSITPLHMYPLDFEEFLWAEGYESGISYLKELFDKKEKVPFALNEKYETLFREYMVVGGMPEVVADYAINHDFTRVAALQEKILENYRFDISKHAKGAEKIKVRKCYDAIPKQLAKEITKFQYSTVEKGQTSKKYGGSVQWLKDSNIVNPCYNIHEPYLPLMANAEEDQFKLYINDTGLLCAMYGFETKRAILENTIKGNAKGGIYENIIAETLVKNGYALYYYKPDDSNELEFLIEKNGEVVPVEVKAGNTATKSLNRFIEAYKPSAAYKIVDGNVGTSDVKLTIPHYMAMFL